MLVRLLPVNVKETLNGPLRCTFSPTQGTIMSKFISCVRTVAASTGNVKTANAAMRHIVRVRVVFFLGVR